MGKHKSKSNCKCLKLKSKVKSKRVKVIDPWDDFPTPCNNKKEKKIVHTQSPCGCNKHKFNPCGPFIPPFNPCGPFVPPFNPCNPCNPFPPPVVSCFNSGRPATLTTPTGARLIAVSSGSVGTFLSTTAASLPIGGSVLSQTFYLQGGAIISNSVPKLVADASGTDPSIVRLLPLGSPVTNSFSFIPVTGGYIIQAANGLQLAVNASGQVVLQTAGVAPTVFTISC